MESATAPINLLMRVKMAVSLSDSFDLAWKVLSCLLKPYLSSFVPRVVHVWSWLDSVRFVAVLGHHLPLSS